MTLLEENTGERLGNHFLDMAPKRIRVKLDKLPYIKCQNFLASKEMIHREGRQPIAWEVVFANR